MQLPVGGDALPRSAPLAVAAIALIDIGLFAYLASLSPHDATAFVDRHGLVPREFLRALTRPAPGSAAALLTPLGSMFLHADGLHLAGNLLFLWIFGVDLERRIGSARFLLFYLACGLVAAAVHVASAPASYLATLGSSGAISGLLGAFAAGGPTRRVRLAWPRVEVSALAFLLLWVTLQLTAGLQALAGDRDVAWWAHVGGFAAGALLARGISPHQPARARLRS